MISPGHKQPPRARVPTMDVDLFDEEPQVSHMGQEEACLQTHVHLHKTIPPRTYRRTPFREQFFITKYITYPSISRSALLVGGPGSGEIKNNKRLDVFLGHIRM